MQTKNKSKISLFMLLLLCCITVERITNSLVVAGSSELEHDVYLPIVLSPTCLYEDEFNDVGSGWPTSSDASPFYGYLADTYYIFHLDAARWTGVTRGDYWKDDTTHVSVELKLRENPPASFYIGGLLFGLNDDRTEFYSFEIDTKVQKWRLYHFTEAGGFELLESGFDILHINQDGENVVEIRSEIPGLLELRTNKKPVAYMEEKAGRVGLVGASLAKNTEIRFDTYKFGCVENSRAVQTSAEVVYFDIPRAVND